MEYHVLPNEHVLRPRFQLWRTLKQEFFPRLSTLPEHFFSLISESLSIVGKSRRIITSIFKFFLKPWIILSWYRFITCYSNNSTHNLFFFILFFISFFFQSCIEAKSILMNFFSHFLLWQNPAPTTEFLPIRYWCYQRWIRTYKRTIINSCFMFFFFPS